MDFSLLEIILIVCLSSIIMVNIIIFLNSKRKNAKQISWSHVIYMTIIILLLILISLSLFTFISNPNSTPSSDKISNMVVNFILAGLAIFIAASVFLPKFALEETVKNAIDKEKKKLAKDKFNFEIEILKTEAHDNRMNSYFLLINKDYIWSFGWAIKSYKQYLLLMKREDFTISYQDLIIEELCNKIFNQLKLAFSKILVLNDNKKNMIERQLKDYYDVLTISEQLKQNKLLSDLLNDSESIINECYQELLKNIENRNFFTNIKLEEVTNRTSNKNEKIDNVMIEMFKMK